MNSQFTILNPCSKRWTGLSGSGRARFCETCRTPVHAIEDYSPKELKKLWQENNGHVCGYLPPRPVYEPRSRRTLLMGALLSFVSPLFAQSGTIRIRVLDTAGFPVPSAEVALIGGDEKPARKLHCDSNGEVAWTDLPIGNNRFRVQVPGFNTLILTIIAEAGKEVQKDVVLQVGTMGTVVDLPGNVHVKKRKHWWIFW